MGREIVWAVAAAVAVVAFFFQLQGVVAKTTHVVGDSLGWIVPPGGAAFYSSWAANQSFAVGDVLLFNFTTGAHTVVQVKKKGYDSCDESNGNTIGSIESTGPTSITLSSTGKNYFMCTVGNHCELGQLVAVNVTAATSKPASPPPHKAAVPPVTVAAPPLSAAPHISPVVAPPVLAPLSKSPQTHTVAAPSPTPSPSTPGSAPSFTRDGVTTFALSLSTVTIFAFFL